MQYHILTSDTLYSLSRDVNDATQSGWEPRGSPVYDADSRMWAQALVKRTPEPPPGEMKIKEPKRK